jgi:hypothetical protein
MWPTCSLCRGKGGEGEEGGRRRKEGGGGRGGEEESHAVFEVITRTDQASLNFVDMA